MRENAPLRITVSTDAAGMRADRWLADELEDLSRSRIQALIQNGSITVGDGSALKPNSSLKAEMELIVRIPPPESTELVAESIPLDILYEDADIVVINKQPGLVVHPAAGHPRGTLVNALLAHCDDLEGVGGELRPGIVHRLDRDTSGVMVVAKRQAAMDSLTRQFRRRKVEKEYVAVLHGIPHPGIGSIETKIGRSRHDRKKMSALPATGRDALTHYQITEVFDCFSLAQITIETGRTHQIRVHMAHIHHPVVGDKVYGKRGNENTPFPVDRQMLHAAHLTFKHPTSKAPISFEAPLPDDMSKLLSALRALS